MSAAAFLCFVGYTGIWYSVTLTTKEKEYLMLIGSHFLDRRLLIVLLTILTVILLAALFMAIRSVEMWQHAVAIFNHGHAPLANISKVINRHLPVG